MSIRFFIAAMSLLWLCPLSAAARTDQPLSFAGYHSGLGLSNDRVFSALQDDDGFMWFGTAEGLNRFDGYRFRSFPQGRAPELIGEANEIQCMAMDGLGRIWLGTATGLSVFDPSSQTQRVAIDLVQATRKPNAARIRALAIDEANQVWLGTDAGLIVFDPQSKEVRHYDKSHGLPSDSVWSLAVQDERVLVGTAFGLCQLDRKTEVVRVFPHESAVNSGKKRIYAVVVSDSGRIWLGTAAGLAYLDQEVGVTRDFQPAMQRRQGLNVCKVRDVYQDARAGLWIATDGNGLYFLDPHSMDFSHIRADPLREGGLSSNRLFDIFEDARQGLWFVGEGGIDRLDTAGSEIRHYVNDPADATSLGSNVVTAVLKDSANRLWVGSDGGGLDRSSGDRARFDHFRADPQDPSALPANQITALAEADGGRIWVGTEKGLVGSDGDGVFTAHPQGGDLDREEISALWVDHQDDLWVGTRRGLFHLTETSRHHFEAHDQDPLTLNSNLIRFVYQDRTQRYWVGTENGFHQLDPVSGRFVRYVHARNEAGSLSSSWVNDAWEDHHGRLWLATPAGLNRMNTSTGEFHAYGRAQGAASDDIRAVLGDDLGYLWLATDAGLSRFNPLMEQFQNFHMGHGLQHLEYNAGAAHAADGELFFGGVNGLNSFNPAKVTRSLEPVAVSLTNFYVFNRPQGVDGAVLHQPIHRTQHLILDHTHDLLSFEFATLDFSGSMENRYAYLMEGFEQEWVFTDAGNRMATYSDLAPGDYRFRVKSMGAAGDWNEGVALALTVKSPPWLTWYAYLLYALMGACLILAYLRSLRAKLLQERKLAAQERRMAEQAREMAEKDRLIAQKERETVTHLRRVDQLKDEFLANTSHELRTPLNAIIGLAESLSGGIAGELPDKAVHNLSMIANSGKRLASLVDDILDFSKLKNHALTIKREPVDLHILVDVIINLCRPLTQHKSLDLINGVPDGLVFVAADENRLQQILFNLVGNAVKFTYSGSVLIEAEQVGERVVVRVVDTGPGISQDEITRIFKPFEQGNGSVSREFGGTGLGLAVTRQLLQLHGGDLDVASAKGAGSTFSFDLPISKDAPQSKSDEPMDRERIESIVETFTDLADNLSGEVDCSKQASAAKQITILLVDDDPANLQVLTDFLTPLGYQVLTADHGEKALELVDHSVDMVLLDVMMPHMSGYEVCAKIRTRFTADQLPVLFLSARNQVWDMARGYEMGANDYLTKPVTKRELLPRIQTHLRIQDVRRSLAKAQRDARDGAKAGLEARFASVVIHNIANVVQSLVISCEQAHLHIRKARRNHPLAESKALLQDPETVSMLSANEVGRKVLDSVSRGAGALDEQYGALEAELAGLLKKTDLVVEIIQERQRRSQEAIDGHEVLALNMLVEEILKTQEPFLEQNGVAVKCGFGRVENIEGKKLHVDHILINLIKNAVEAMSETHRGARQLRLSTGTSDGFGFVRLSDNGPGIPAEATEKVFEHGFTTKSEGSGFGLPYCKKMMDQMGGRIVLEPGGDSGAAFSLYFPLAGSKTADDQVQLTAVGR